MPTRFLTPEDVAEILNVEASTIRKWLREGILKGVKFGGLWRIPEDELEEFIRKSQAQEVDAIEYGIRKG